MMLMDLMDDCKTWHLGIRLGQILDEVDLRKAIEI